MAAPLHAGMASRLSISLVIPTLNAGRAFGTTLHRLQTQRRERFETLIVDSGSQDATRHIVSQFPEARFVEAGVSPGPRAWNRVCALARGDLVVFLGQDAVPADPEWLGRLTDPLEDPSLAAVYGRQAVTATLHPIAAYRLSRRFPPQPHERRARFGDPVTHRSLDFSIGNAALRHSVWEGIRFNEHLPAAADREWARQALFASYTIAYVPQATVERTLAPGLDAAFREALLCGWTDQLLGQEAGSLRPDDDRFVKRAAWHLVKGLRLDQLPYLFLEDAAHRYGYRVGRLLHRLAPSIRRRIAPEIASEEPRRELTERERMAA